ncbi:YopX family protein [Rummeliibacillus stabekisii]|uniref:YopX protein domain-containing protein n=1 Tax=Rummeliibacillus stabekisii TaxID=241244 RepID=A0A143HG22_9BACL|nr:YopX family protein [Rummeliibacillus stabekisii]AMX00436.1 hypothetical protein ATY39_14050 [Rummeliibacillus stabekisii]
MQEIKFRGKSLLNNKWYEGDFITDVREYERTCDKAYILPRWDKLNVPIQVDPNTVSQFTGQKDKVNHEIYLNDIAKREFDIWKTDYDNDGSPLGDELIEEGYFVGVVSQTPSGMYVLNKCRKYDIEGNLLKKCSGVKLFAHRCEVIGNIYENPELLEGVNVG